MRSDSIGIGGHSLAPVIWYNGWGIGRELKDEMEVGEGEMVMDDFGHTLEQLIPRRVKAVFAISWMIPPFSFLFSFSFFSFQDSVTLTRQLSLSPQITRAEILPVCLRDLHDNNSTSLIMTIVPDIIWQHISRIRTFLPITRTRRVNQYSK
jgi:hypothetical protein